MEPSESLYCAKFIIKCHKLGNQEFMKYMSSIHTVSGREKELKRKKIAISIIPMLHCCSEKEAFNLGVFFKELFHPFVNWQEEKQLMEVLEKSKERAV